MSVLRHARSIIFLPGIVTIIVPVFLLWATDSLNIGWSLPKPVSFAPSIIGLLFIGTGLILWIWSVGLFGTVGQGTLAPWDPPQKLVIRGSYRYVRNPMITGAICILLGETLLLGSAWLLAWFILFLAINIIYIPFFEEPGLERRFGHDYLVYKQHVPRWIPRIKPWKPTYQE